MNDFSEFAACFNGDSESSGSNLSSLAISCNGKKVLVTKDFNRGKSLILNREESTQRQNLLFSAEHLVSFCVEDCAQSKPPTFRACRGFPKTVQVFSS